MTGFVSLIFETLSKLGVPEPFPKLLTSGLTAAALGKYSVRNQDTVLIDCLHGYSWGRHLVFNDLARLKDRYDGMLHAFHAHQEIYRPEQSKSGRGVEATPRTHEQDRQMAFRLRRRWIASQAGALEWRLTRNNSWPLLSWAMLAPLQPSWVLGHPARVKMYTIVSILPFYILLVLASALGSYRSGLLVLLALCANKLFDCFVLVLRRAIVYVPFCEVALDDSELEILDHAQIIVGLPNPSSINAPAEAVRDFNEGRVRRQGRTDYAPVLALWPRRVEWETYGLISWFGWVIRGSLVLTISQLQSPWPEITLGILLAQALLQRKACTTYAAQHARMPDVTWFRSLPAQAMPYGEVTIRL